MNETALLAERAREGLSLSGSILDHFLDWEFLGKIRKKAFLQVDMGKYIRQRTEAIRQDDRELELAEKLNLPVTQIEMDIGERKEILEPQVRDAVLALQAKGINTYNSGYEPGSRGLQFIHIISLQPIPIEIVKGVWQITDQTGILTWMEESLPVDNYDFDDYTDRKQVYTSSIRFISNGDPQELRKHWDLIVDRIPDMGWQRLVCNSYFAKKFRQTHELVEV